MRINVPTSLTGFNRLVLFRVFFFAVFLFLIFQLIRLFQPFLGAIMSALTLTVIFHPIYSKLHAKTGRPNLSAGLSTAFILLLFIIPVLLLAWVVLREASTMIPAAREFFWAAQRLPQTSFAETLPDPLARIWLSILERFPILKDMSPGAMMLAVVNQVGDKITSLGTRALRNAVFLVFDLLVMGFTLFFLLRDGPKLIRWLVDHIPMEAENKNMIMRRHNDTFSAVVRGVFLTATTQAVLAGIGYFIAGVQFPIVLIFATGFMALVPFVGTPGVWLPTALALILSGHVPQGIFLLIWGFGVVSLVDNFMRPILIGEKAKLPVALLFFGILGGLQVYGVVGILIGPLLIATVLAFAKIYREQYQRGAMKAETPNAL